MPLTALPALPKPKDKGKAKTTTDFSCPISPTEFADPTIHIFPDSTTGTKAFLVADPQTNHAILIDPILNSNRENIISSATADAILATASQHKYTIDRILETQGPITTTMTHRSAAWYIRTQLREATGHVPRVSSGKSFSAVSRMFARKYGIQDVGWQFDDAFQDGQAIELGGHVLRLPTREAEGHLGIVVGGCLFVGDGALMERHEAAETDFEDESMHLLWTSLQRLLSLPREVRVYCSQGRGQGTEGRDYCTVEELRKRCGLLGAG